MSAMRQIKKFPDYYITEDGEVYSWRSVRKLKCRTDSQGYLRVFLVKDGKTFSVSVHRLVAEAFIPNPENKPEVNHIDGDKQNAKKSNLEWVTHSENIKHSIHVLGHNHCAMINKGKFGKENRLSKIVLQIKDGVVIKEFFCLREASEATKIGAANIGFCCRGITKTAGGFQWKYKQKGN